MKTKEHMFVGCENQIPNMQLTPQNIQQIGNELAIVWNDGLENYFSLETLRKACPCASCGGEPDVLGRIVQPKVSYNERSFTLKGVQIIGGYALQPTWGDGHSTGLYSWQYLRNLAKHLEQQAE
jgi:DUF971 family protein